MGVLEQVMKGIMSFFRMIMLCFFAEDYVFS